MDAKFQISEYPFNADLESSIIENHREFLAWPLVYLLRNDRVLEAYIGETTDVINRLKTHSKNEQKQKNSEVHLILSKYFNKSATLDLESNLIRYLHADGKFKLQNGNLGLTNHSYHQRELYWEIFQGIWNELRGMGIARHSLDHIDNSDLFKYSPYKTLSPEQLIGLKTILQCLLDENSKTTLIHGGAGTGKTILALFIFKLLKTDLSNFNLSDFGDDHQELIELISAVKEKYGDQLEMALVIPMSSFRTTISKVFKNISGLSPKMVIGPAELASKKYDLVIVDEAHRLRRRVNLGSYFKSFDDASEKLGFDKFEHTELDWVLKQSKKSLMFYDRFQTIKPSDVSTTQFDKLANSKYTRVEVLKNQFRSQGGNDLVAFIGDLLDGNLSRLKPFQHSKFELKLFDDLSDMTSAISEKEKEYQLSRLVAGYAWEWVSKNDNTKNDIVIGDVELKWNSKNIDWVNSANAINEVGCIHTTQGYDLNYVGVIIGPELDYDFEMKSLIIYPERYKDKAGKNTIKDPQVLKDFILNIYKTILLRGIRGTYIYACNPNLRTFLSQYIGTHPPKMSEVVQLEMLDSPNENTVPFYNLWAAAGSFSDLQQVTEMKYIEIDDSSNTYSDSFFACKVEGESMNKVIPSGSICLFDRNTAGSRNGKIVLVELTDFRDEESGSSYTVKEYSSKKTISEDGWEHAEIRLLPLSTESFSPIVLRDEETQRLKIIGVFVRVLGVY